MTWWIRIRSSRLLVHAPAFIVLWLILSRLNTIIDPYYSHVMAMVAMYAIAMLGMVILVGLSGQVSLGNGALMAVGGYAFALTSMHWTTVPLIGVPWNAVWSVIAAGLLGVGAGFIIGLIAARLRGPYLAGFTLGLAVGIPAIANRFAFLGGSNGFMLTVPYPDGGYADSGSSDVATTDNSVLDQFLSPSPGASDALPSDALPSNALPSDVLPSDAGASDMASSDMLTMDDVTGSGPALTPSPTPTLTPAPSASASDLIPTTPSGTVTDPGFIIEQWQASMAIAVACIAGFVALNLVRGRQGRRWRAVRDDPIAAAMAGISPGMSKVSAFTVSSLFAALSGAVFAQLLTYVGPSAYGVGLSLALLVGVILGGRASLLGGVIGAAIIVVLPSLVGNVAEGRGWPAQVSDNAPNLLYGLLLVLVVLVAPGGIVGTARDLAAKVRR
jgi:ABC-type branched-subunit amino acid transport system permease subunit